ncbi:MAG: hypothetical protein IJP75_09820 [Bacteroidaceae bacterium]|nr:hypothetical protein [Bacteroidaceae bacterium]
MKRNILLLSLLLLLVAAFSSCSKDPHAEATCTYYVETDSIKFTEEDEAQYDSILTLYVAENGISSYVFKENASTDKNLLALAIDMCDQKALNTFQTKVPVSLDLATVKTELYNSHTDFFTQKGIQSVDEVQLHPFTVYVTLLNYTYGVPLKSVQIFAQ